MAPQFHSLTVKSVEPQTRDAVSVTFDVPAPLADTFRYREGQYLTLRTHIGGEEVRRSYSICAARQDGRLRVAIKRVAGGAFSNWAADALIPGARVDVLPPQGSFCGDQAPPRHLLAVAAGSGITPILSIVKTALLESDATRVTLLYGNRASGSVMFRDELSDLKDAYLHRLNLIYVMSRESQDIDLFNGRIDAEKCDALLTHWIDPATIDTAFLCGPHDMMQTVAAALQAKGVDKSRIRMELFAAANGQATIKRAQRLARPALAQCTVEVIADGVRRRFTMDKHRDNLIDAGLKAGLDMPYSCKGGVCSTCRAKVMEGEVDMDNNFALEDYEIARGFVLCCQSYPVSDKLVIDFDQEHAHS